MTFIDGSSVPIAASARCGTRSAAALAATLPQSGGETITRSCQLQSRRGRRSSARTAVAIRSPLPVISRSPSSAARLSAPRVVTFGRHRRTDRPFISAAPAKLAARQRSLRPRSERQNLLFPIKLPVIAFPTGAFILDPDMTVPRYHDDRAVTAPPLAPVVAEIRELRGDGRVTSAPEIVESSLVALRQDQFQSN